MAVLRGFASVCDFMRGRGGFGYHVQMVLELGGGCKLTITLSRFNDLFGFLGTQNYSRTALAKTAPRLVAVT